MPDMHQAILILRGAADLVGRSPFPLADAAQTLGVEWTSRAFRAARAARDEALPSADTLVLTNNKRDQGRLFIAFLEAARRLAVVYGSP